MNWRGATGLLVALCATAGMVGAATDGFRVLTTDGARARDVALHPVIVPATPLLDMNGRAVPFAVADRVTIVDFVYTRCPTLCGALGGAYQRLQTEVVHRGLQSRVRLLTVSFDPVWDTPERLRYYAVAMRPDSSIWTVATLPDTTALAPMLATFGVRVIPDGANGFAHNAALHVVDTAGRLVGIFPVDATDASISAAIERALDRAIVLSDVRAPAGVVLPSKAR